MTNTTTYTNTAYATAPKRKTDFAEIWAIITMVCAFLPLISTLAWLLYAIPGMPIFVTDYILVPMMFIGWGATVLSCPLKLLKLIGKMVLKPFLAGLCIPILPINLFLACLFGGAGACALLALLAFAPAIVTLVNFFKCE